MSNILKSFFMFFHIKKNLHLVEVFSYILKLVWDCVSAEDIEDKVCDSPSEEDNHNTYDGIDDDFLSCLFSFIFSTRSEDFPATPESHTDHDETEECK